MLPLDQSGPDESLLSPSLQTSEFQSRPAFEMKFLVSDVLADEIQAWGLAHLDVDPYADRDRNCSYETTTVYLDTLQLDLFHRASGFRGRKYRLRRYGSEGSVSLERKIRRKDRVRKRRSRIQLDELSHLTDADCSPDWPGEWFRSASKKRALSPSCCLTYDRAAFVKATASGTLRLTLDRGIRGIASQHWRPEPVTTGAQILSGQVICELKFRDALPALFQQLVAEKQLAPASVSKYRLMMSAIQAASRIDTLSGDE